MKKTGRFLAFDLGAESGRAVLGTLADGVIRLEVGKAQLRIEGGVDAATLALVLEHLLR